MPFPILSTVTDRLADVIRAELRRQHGAIVAERDAAVARADTAESLLSASRAAVLDLEAAIAGMSRAQARAAVAPAPISTLTAAHLQTLGSFGQDTGGFRVNGTGSKALAEAINAIRTDLAAARASPALSPAPSPAPSPVAGVAPRTLPGAASPDPHRPTCGICDRPLDPATMKAAEMTIDGDWYVPGAVPAGVESQGVFDVGSDCYRRRVKDPTPATLTRQRKAAAAKAGHETGPDAWAMKSGAEDDPEIARWSDEDYRRKYGGPGPQGGTAIPDPIPATLTRQRKAAAAKAAAATMDTGPAPAPKISRNADRGAVLREAARIDCPACMASPGAPCFDDDDGEARERPSFHGDRLGAARKRLDGARARLTVRCPTCDAPEGVPCVVDGRRGLHTDRKAP